MCHVTLTVMSWGILSCTFPHSLSEAKTPAFPLPGFLSAMHAHTLSHTYAHTRILSHMPTLAPKHPRVHMHKYTYTHSQTHIHTYSNTHSHICPNTYIYSHIPQTHTCTQMHLHANTHLHTNTHSHTCTQFAYYFSSPELDCVPWAVDTSPSLEGVPNYSCFPLSELVVRSTWPELLKTPATLMSQAMAGSEGPRTFSCCPPPRDMVSLPDVSVHSHNSIFSLGRTLIEHHTVLPGANAHSHLILSEPQSPSSPTAEPLSRTPGVQKGPALLNIL